MHRKPFIAEGFAATVLILLISMPLIARAAPPGNSTEARVSEAPASGKFNISVNQMPARDFFITLMEGTRQNIMVSPDMSGNITLRLNNVTLEEALKAVRDSYGYDFVRTGYGYQISAANQGIRTFRLNYLNAVRKGYSDTLVAGRSMAQSSDNKNSSSANNSGNSGTNAYGNSTRILTESRSDFWTDLQKTLDMILGGNGKAIINPQSGVIVVTATPELLKAVEQYLRQTEESLSRQVIIEAKIIEVELNDGFQAGINWSQISRADGKEIIVGVGAQTSPGVADIRLSNPDKIGGVFGLSVIGNNFSGILELLQTQGTVNVLSSPRVAAINNQKAVIKVGTDEFFVTDVSFTNMNSGSSSSTSVIVPDLTLTPFFSGIALDVTPQINSSNDIILHIHPSVSEVTQQQKEVDLGDAIGNFSLPLAYSKNRESDTVVRAENGKVVVIGGLMSRSQQDTDAAVPLLGRIPVLKYLFSQKRKASKKTELVILLRPMIAASVDVDEFLRENGDRLQLSPGDFPSPATRADDKAPGKGK